MTISAHNPNYHSEYDLLSFCNTRKFKTILADPPWQFHNRTGKMAPEHKRLNRYSTMKLDEIKAIPVNEVARRRR
jgi:N6-adenosine-specific RNA methylase IME4